MERLIEILHGCQDAIRYGLEADWGKEKLREFVREISMDLAAAEEEAWDHAHLVDCDLLIQPLASVQGSIELQLELAETKEKLRAVLAAISGALILAEEEAWDRLLLCDEGD